METTKQITKRILKIAFPMAGARIINMISVFVGMIFVSRLGHAALAASALITASYYPVLVIFMFVLFSVGIVTGRYYGAKNFADVGDLLQQAALLALMLAIPLILIFWYFGPILLHFGQNPRLIVYVAQYFHALVWMAVPMLLFTCMSQFMFAVTKILNVVIASVLGVTSFMFVAYALIFGHWGAPDCGIAGFAYALTVQEVVSLLYLLGCYALQKDMHIYGLFRFKRQRDWSRFKTLWQVGWPMSIQFGGELLGFFAITVLIGLLSVNDLAAWQVVQQIMMVFIVPVFSFAEASAIVVGHTMGAKEYQNLDKVNRISTFSAMLFVLCGILCFMFLPKQLASIYMEHQNLSFQEALLPMISLLFFINAFVYFFDSIRNLMSGSLRGLYDTRFPMVSGIFVVWVIGVGFGALLAFKTKLGIYGFSIAQASAFFLGAIAVVWRWRWQMRAYQ